MYVQYERSYGRYYPQEVNPQSIGLFNRLNPPAPQSPNYEIRNFGKFDQRGDSANCIPKCFAEKGNRVS
ncbi:hypothetical protein J6590_052976 [Homalodisca vitripennis]|nr:hypothetical protein J6590_052976 [Homalodisca vitripennis]